MHIASTGLFSTSLAGQNALLIFFSTSAAGSSTAMLLPLEEDIFSPFSPGMSGVCMHTGAGSPRRGSYSRASMWIFL